MVTGPKGSLLHLFPFRAMANTKSDIFSKTCMIFDFGGLIILKVYTLEV